MRRVIFNQKGGVGKSSITCNLAAVAAQKGQRVLVVDLDAQANSTHYLLGNSATPEGPTLADFFDQTLNFKLNPHPIDAFILPTPFQNLSLMAAHAELEALQSKLESRYKIFKLREALEAIDADFDWILIDTPPALNFYTRSALIAADRCLIPFDCDAFSRRALYTLMENVHEIQADHNSGLAIEGIIINQFVSRATLPQKVVTELIAEGLPVLSPYLPASIKLKESHECARPMIDLDPRHKLTEAFLALYGTLTGSQPPKTGSGH